MQSTNSRLGLLTLIVFGFLTACGGGGGSSDTPAQAPAPPPPPSDTTPDPFSFTDQTDVDRNQIIESNSLTLQGVDASTPISISVGEYSIDGGAFTNTDGNIDNGQSFTVRVTSASQLNTTVDATLTIGGVSDTFSVTTLADTAAPSAVMTFPPLKSITESSRVTVRGTASDALSAISAVRINGVEAKSTDGFTTWSADLTLVTGNNSLTVETEDSAQNIDSLAFTAEIRRDAPFREPVAIALDASNSRALVIDRAIDGKDAALIAVDIKSGLRTALSDNKTPDAKVPFELPGALTLDLANTRALVLNTRTAAMLAVDLISGERSIISDTNTPNSKNPFSFPIDIALDTSNNRALVIDLALRALISVDLTSGERTIISDNSNPDSNNPFSNPSALTLDSNNNRALIVDNSSGTLFAVDLVSGIRTIISDENTLSNESLVGSIDIDLDSANNRALVMTSGNIDRLLSVNLTNGLRTRISVNNDPTAPLTEKFSGPLGIAFDSDNDKVLVLDSAVRIDRIFSVNLTNGARSIVSDNNTPNNSNIFGSPRRIAIDRENKRALITDVNDTQNIFAMDLNTGARTILSNNTIPDANNRFQSPVAIEVDSANGRALVSDNSADTIFSVDLVNGARTIFSNTRVKSIVADGNSIKVLTFNNEIISIDSSTGTQTILSSNGTPDFDNIFSDPSRMVLDKKNNRLLVLDPSLSTIFSVDLISGIRTILSDDSTPNNVEGFIFPESMAIDIKNNRLLISDISTVRKRILAVDLDSGARTLFSINDIPSDENAFTGAGDIIVDEVNDRAILVDSFPAAIIMIDLVNGERVQFSN